MSEGTIGIDVGGSSIKAALMSSGVELATAKSDRYDSPDTPTLVKAVAEAVSRLGPRARLAERAGLCVPGVRSSDGLTVTESVNLPGMVGVQLASLVNKAVGNACALTAVTSDVHAAAVDIHARKPVSGRLLVIAMGTGVGACVLDDGVQVKLTGASSGHLGQIDVSLEIAGEETPVGRDGGRGSLEAYIGLPALEARYGKHLEHVAAVLDGTSPPLRALARAIRTAHAIYRPNRIVLAGGVGVLLNPKIAIIRAMVEKDLTRLARPEWMFSCAENVFHAAAGAARLAATG